MVVSAHTARDVHAYTDFRIGSPMTDDARPHVRWDHRSVGGGNAVVGGRSPVVGAGVGGASRSARPNLVLYNAREASASVRLATAMPMWMSLPGMQSLSSGWKLVPMQAVQEAHREGLLLGP